MCCCWLCLLEDVWQRRITHRKSKRWTFYTAQCHWACGITGWEEKEYALAVLYSRRYTFLHSKCCLCFQLATSAISQRLTAVWANEVAVCMYTANGRQECASLPVRVVAALTNLYTKIVDRNGWLSEILFIQSCM